MPDRPIILSAPMIRALLDGRKTQTRRVLKLNWRRPEYCGPDGCQADPTCWGWEDHNHGDLITLEKEPGQRMGWRDWRGAYAPGDRLWVRETIIGARGYDALPPSKWGNKPIWYLADGDPDRAKWFHLSDRKRSPIHMPRCASRITLTVTDVRVQRVQGISEADAIAEGISAADVRMYPELGTARMRFRDLWDSIHGPGAWERNEWVAALTFDVKRGNIDG